MPAPSTSARCLRGPRSSASQEVEPFRRRGQRKALSPPSRKRDLRQDPRTLARLSARQGSDRCVRLAAGTGKKRFASPGAFGGTSASLSSWASSPVAADFNLISNKKERATRRGRWRQTSWAQSPASALLVDGRPPLGSDPARRRRARRLCGGRPARPARGDAPPSGFGLLNVGSRQSFLKTWRLTRGRACRRGLSLLDTGLERHGCNEA